MRSVLFATVVALLGGCALLTTAGYEKMLDTWVGRQEIDLVRSWGAPDRVYEVDGRKFIGYSSHHRVYESGTPTTIVTTITHGTESTTTTPGTHPTAPRTCRAGPLSSWTARGWWPGRTRGTTAWPPRSEHGARGRSWRGR